MPRKFPSARRLFCAGYDTGRYGTFITFGDRKANITKWWWDWSKKRKGVMAEGSVDTATSEGVGTGVATAQASETLPGTDHESVQHMSAEIKRLFARGGALFGKLYSLGLRDIRLIEGLAGRLQAAGKAPDAQSVRDMLADPSLQLGTTAVNDLIEKAVRMANGSKLHEFSPADMKVFKALEKLTEIAKGFYGQQFPGLDLTSQSGHLTGYKAKSDAQHIIDQWLAAAVAQQPQQQPQSQPGAAAETPPVPDNGSQVQQPPADSGTVLDSAEASLPVIAAQLAELRKRNVDPSKDQELAAEQDKTLQALDACLGRLYADPAIAQDKRKLAALQSYIKTIMANYNSLEKMRDTDVQQAYANMRKEFGITREALKLQREIETTPARTEAEIAQYERRDAQADLRTAEARAREENAPEVIAAQSEQKIAAAEASTAQSNLRAARAEEEAKYVPERVEMEQNLEYAADWRKLVSLGIKNFADVEKCINTLVNDRNLPNIGRVTQQLLRDDMRDANNWTKNMQRIVNDWGRAQGYPKNGGLLGLAIGYFGNATAADRRKRVITEDLQFAEETLAQRRAAAEARFQEMTGVSPQFMAHFRTLSELHGGNIPGGTGGSGDMREEAE